MLNIKLINIKKKNTYEVIPDAEVLLQLSSPESPPVLPNRIRLLSWNVEKAGAKLKWSADFQNLAAQHEIILIQEGMADNFMPNHLREMPGFEWWMAQSWRDAKKHSTGVMTGAHAKSEQVWFLRSPHAEPISRTPKMTLAQIFAAQNGAKLLVLNTHGINFVLNRAFKAQMDEIFSLVDAQLAKYPDLKVIFGGDFNTWNTARLQYLTVHLSGRGFLHAEFHNRGRHHLRNMHLDHIFLRNCQLIDAQMLQEIRTSDHHPLHATIELSGL